MNYAKKKLILIILVILSFAVFFLPAGGAIRPPIAFLNIFYLPGMVFLLLILDEKLTPWDLLFMPLLISPVIVVLLVLGFFAITHSHLLASYLVFALTYIVAIYYILKKKPSEEEEKSNMPLPVVLISAGFALMIAVLYIVNPFLTVRSDSWYHASVVLEILDRGIPPMEPRFPDVPIRYMWIYHLFIATWKMVSGLPVFASLATFNVIGALCFPYLTTRITGFFRSGKRYLILTPIFAIAGLESVSWILWPAGLVRAFFGEVRGIAEVARMLKEIKLNSSDVIQSLHPYGTWMVNLIDKYITITAFSYSLDLFALAFVIFLMGWRSSKRNIGTGLTIAAISAGTLLFHVITGSALILTIIGSGILAFLVYRLIAREYPSSFVEVIAPLSAVVAGALCFEYVASLTAGNVTSNGSILSLIHIGARNIATIALPLLILYCPARRAFSKIFGSEWRRFEPFAFWAAALLALNILVDLPTRNESKLIFPLFILILPPIIWEAIDIISYSSGIKKGLLIAWTVLLFFVPPVLTVRGFLLDKPNKPIERGRFVVSKGERGVFEWIMENTDKYAAIMENNIKCLMPVFAHRRSFFPPPSAINVVGYGGEKVKLYGELKREIFSKKPITTDTIEKLKKVKNDLYIVVWREDVEKNLALRDKFSPFSRWFKKVFSSKDATIYHFERGNTR